MWRNHLILLAGLLALSTPALRADDTNLVLRIFHLQPSFIEIIEEEQQVHPYVEVGGDKSPETIREKNWMDFLRKYGLTFPPGSYLRHTEAKLTLLHYNTEQNQKLLGRLVAEEGSLAMQVRLDALFVDFPRKDIERLARANPAPSAEDFLKLWKSGKGSLLHALNLITQSGVNAQVMAASEHIYATEFRTPIASNATDAASPLPIPNLFETREAGVIFNATPTAERNNRTIMVVLAPDLTAKPEWQTQSFTGTDANGKEIHLSVPQPLFHSRNITTSLLVRDGDTTVLGGMENPAGDGFTYLFLTATLIDDSGQPLADYAGEPVPDSELDSRPLNRDDP